MNEYIVRADFYPDGSIIPLGFTNKQGETIYIGRVIKTTILSNNPYSIRYECDVDGKRREIDLRGNKWILFEEK